ncbi:MAG: hypothetical protein H7Y13_08420 [Sphingobacteriaceae bacterium]|nr:hypothetical protein [Sphingobacteriaceae bacterium]
MIRALLKAGSTLLTIFLVNCLYAQENYVPGYIIDLKGDTVKGFVDYRNWEVNPKRLNFKNDMGVPDVYFPTNIIEFKALDEIYVGAIVEVEISPYEDRFLLEDPVPKFRRDTVFLNTMIRGKKSLYYYRSINGRHNFYTGQYPAFELLVTKKYFKKEDGRTLIAYNKRYIGQLSLYLNDCSDLQQMINTTTYTPPSMSKLFKHYYNCTTYAPAFHKEVENIKTETGALLGASLSSLRFKGADLPYLSQADFTESASVAAGLFFDAILPRNQGKWSIHNELLFTNYSIDGIYTDYSNENSFTITKSRFAYSYLKVYNMLRYKYPVGGIFMHINGGISNGYALKAKQGKTADRTFYSTHEIGQSAALTHEGRYEFGYTAGLGFKRGCYTLDLRAESGTGMSQIPNTQSVSTRYFCLLGYGF